VQHEFDHIHGKLFIDYLDPLGLHSIGEKLREFELSHQQAQQAGEIPPDDELVRRLHQMTQLVLEPAGDANGPTV
jgi:hypothetical protein